MSELLIDLDAYPGRAKLQVRAAMAVASEAARCLVTAAPAGLNDATVLRLGPDQWMLVSDRLSSGDLADGCATAFAGSRHHAVDASAALACASLRGPQVRKLLSMGSGIDWHAARPAADCCVRTRFARIPVIVHVAAQNAFDLYYDRSYRHYLECWIAHASSDPLIAGDSCRSTS